MKFRHIDELHKFFAGGGVGAFLAGVGTAIKADNIDFECIYLAIICIIMRFKFWVDDREYFYRVEAKKIPNKSGFQFGLVLGMLSWMPWIIAGLAVGKIGRCAWIMIIVFIFSILWIISTSKDKRLSNLQIGWLLLNLLYISLFLVLAIRDYTWVPPLVYDYEIGWLAETALLAVVVADAYISGTLAALSKFTDPDSK